MLEPVKGNNLPIALAIVAIAASTGISILVFLLWHFVKAIAHGAK